METCRKLAVTTPLRLYDDVLPVLTGLQVKKFLVTTGFRRMHSWPKSRKRSHDDAIWACVCRTIRDDNNERTAGSVGLISEFAV